MYAFKVLTACFLWLTLSSSQDPARPDLSDEDLAEAVEEVLLVEGGVPTHVVTVLAEKGIVTLSGPVKNLLIRERAAGLARRVKGVRSFVNGIRVFPNARDDVEIRNDVRRALEWDPATMDLEIRADFEAGVVVLKGKAESLLRKELAERIVMAVPGVSKIRNQIDVKPGQVRSDHELANDIRQLFRWNVLLDDGKIDVAVEGGQVHLTGMVGSTAEKAEAVRTADRAAVTHVDVSELDVRWWADRETLRKDKFGNKDDEAIQAALRAAYKQDPRVSRFNVRIRVNHGTVTLRGSVENLLARMAAEEDARNTVGVWRVRNRLKVRPGGNWPDERVKERIKRRLSRSPFLSGERRSTIEFRSRNTLREKTNENDSGPTTRSET